MLDQNLANLARKFGVWKKRFSATNYQSQITVDQSKSIKPRTTNESTGKLIKV